MLKTPPLFLKQHMQAAINSLNQLCRTPIASLVTLSIITLALTLPTLFWVVTEKLALTLSDWQRSGHIALFLQQDSPESEREALMKSLKALPQVAEVSFISAEQGLQLLTAQEGMGDLMSYLPENPLPPVIQVNPALSVNTPERLHQLVNQLKSEPLVEQVKIDSEWIENMQAAFKIMMLVSDFLILLLASAIILIIANTLRMSLYHQHEEIRLMKLIGATEPYILRPFLYAGIIYGFLAAVMSILLVNIFIYGFALALRPLLKMYQMNYPLTGMSFGQVLLLVAFSTIIGWLGARLSVKRQLASIEAYN